LLLQQNVTIEFWQGEKEVLVRADPASECTALIIPGILTIMCFSGLGTFPSPRFRTLGSPLCCTDPINNRISFATN